MIATTATLFWHWAALILAIVFVLVWIGSAVKGEGESNNRTGPRNR